MAGSWPRPTPTAETDQQVGPVSSARDGDRALRVEYTSAIIIVT